MVMTKKPPTPGRLAEGPMANQGTDTVAADNEIEKLCALRDAFAPEAAALPKSTARRGDILRERRVAAIAERMIEIEDRIAAIDGAGPRGIAVKIGIFVEMHAPDDTTSPDRVLISALADVRRLVAAAEGDPGDGVHPDRRSLILGSIAAAVAGDAVLSLFVEWQRPEKFANTVDSDDERDVAVAAAIEIERRITALPATSLAALLAKAKIALFYGEDAPALNGGHDLDRDMVPSLARDLEWLAAGNT
jgi:hypothetical protein